LQKIKEIWIKNKVLIVLVIILIICFFAICTVAITYFFGGSESVYGDRLKDIDKYPITDEFKNSYISTLESEEIEKNVKIRNEGRVIFITVNFNEDTIVLDAQSKVASMLEIIPDELLSYYDFNYILNCNASENSDGFTIMGAKNTLMEGINWNNNTKIEESEEES